MRINNNMMAMNTHRQLGIATEAGAKSMEKLSSGYRINKAGDDAAGLSISEKMRNQIRGLDRASSNAQDGISLIQTAEGALDETHSILKRMRELTVQAGNAGTLQEEDMDAIKDELDALAKEIDGIGERTQFNGKDLLDGSYDSTLQIGANKNQGMNIKISQKISSEGLDVKDIIEDEEEFKFDDQIERVDSAIKKVSKQRSELGANQNRLEHTIKNLDNAGENLQAAESRIRDVDMAKEMMEQTRQNILQQASTAMLAQANQAPQNVLSLLR